jgi:hypothetical protein
MVTDGDFRFAAVVDGVGADGTPVVAPDRGYLTNATRRERVLTYLRAGAPVWQGEGAEPDAFDPLHPRTVPVGFRTDGRWIWPEAVAYYLERYHVAPEPEFADRINRYGYMCPPVTATTVETALKALRERSGG